MNTLSDRLNALRRRLLRLGLAGGAAWGAVAAVGVLVLWMWADLGLELSSPARAAARWVALVTLAGMSIWFLLQAVRFATTAHLARKLDEAAGTQGQILTGVDLAAAPAGEGVTAGLASMAVKRAESLVRQVEPAKVAPASSLRKPAIAAALTVAAILLVFIFAPRLAATQLARIFDPYGDHPPYSRVQFIVEPGDVSVIYGAGFDIRMSTEGGLVEKADIVLVDTGVTLPMFDEGGGKWRATIASVTEQSRYFVRSPGSASNRYTVSVITIPKLENVRVRISPPAYTHRPPFDGPVPQAGIVGLPGTKVELFARSNRPLSGGVIQYEAGPRFEMTGSGQEALGSFTLDTPGKITLRVTDTAGQSSADSFSTTITLLKDERPFVRMMQPVAQSFATPSTSLPIDLIAEDDFGISRLQVFRSLNDSRPLPMEVPVSPEQPTRLHGQDMLPLAAFDLKPGDVIKLFARVEDNDPAGAKGTECPVAVVRIISEEDFKRMILTREGMETLQSKYAQAQRRMEALAEEIRKLKEEVDKADKDGPLSDELRKKLEDLAQRMEQEAAAVENEAKDDLPFDLDKALKEHLDEVAKKMREAAKQASKMAQKNPQKNGEASEELEKLAAQLAGQKEEFRREAMEPLEHLAKIFPLLEDEARFIRLYEMQKDLVERLASIKTQDHIDDPKEKARMRDLEEEQRALREELKRLLDDIEQHARELPDDPRLDELRKMAMNFAQAVRESPAEDRMLDAELALNEFDGKKAYAGALAAQEILSQFISRCQAMEGEGKACLKFQPGLSSGMGNTVQQLLDAAGLGKGNSQGDGSGGGYSTRRSSLRNVGLYGKASASRSARSGAGHSDGGTGGESRGGHTDLTDPAGVAEEVHGRATGESDVAVPLKYKRRVGDYFRRVADEIGEK
ncbi:MAG: hypothetical protein WD768_18155 [Phycisphaeraceae bacterium]